MQRALLTIGLLFGCVAIAGAQTYIEPSYFGQHMELIGGLVASPATPFPMAAQGGQFGTFRLWDTAYWTSIESNQGQYNWSVVNGIAAILRPKNVDMIFTFGYVPTWASTNPTGNCSPVSAGQCYPPTDSAWTDFVTHVVQQNCGAIKYYELWNEANLSLFYSGSPAGLVHLASLAYPIIKSTANCSINGTNPNQVLMPSISDLSSGSISWLRSYLDAGGGAYADIGAFHGYNLATRATGYVLATQLTQWVANYKAVLAAYGLYPPIWNTEYSWGQTDNFPISQLGESARQAFIGQTMLLFAASGVSRNIWYMYDACDWGTMYGPNCGTAPNRDNHKGPRITATAYGSIQTWMTGATLNGCTVTGNTWACSLTRTSPSGYSAQAVWTEGRSVLYAIPPGTIQYRDLNGGVHPVTGSTVKITAMPILLENSNTL